MRSIVKSAAAVAAAACLVVTLGGTTFATTPSKTAPTPLQVASSYMKAPVNITQKIPLKTKPPTGIRAVYFLAPNAQQETIYRGIKEVADTLSWNLSTITWTASNGASIESAFNTALQQGAEVIFAPALDLMATSASIKQKLLDAKVPVIVGQACPDSPLVAPFFGGPSMCQQVAPEAIALSNWVAADANGKPANVLQLSTIQFSSLRTFGVEFKKQLSIACPKNCTSTFQPITHSQAIANQIPSLVVNRLRADPTLNYIIFDAGFYATGILPALDAAGLLGKVKIIGKAMGADQQAALISKQEDAWSTAPYGSQGYSYIDSAFRVLTKSSGISLNAIQPLQLLTTVNVGTVPNPYLFAPTDALAQFKKLWGM